MALYKSMGVATFERLCTFQATSPQEGYCRTRQGAKEGCTNIQRTRTPACRMAAKPGQQWIMKWGDRSQDLSSYYTHGTGQLNRDSLHTTWELAPLSIKGLFISE